MCDETDPAAPLNKLIINDSHVAATAGLKSAPLHWFPRRGVLGILMLGLGVFSCGETSAPSDETTTAGDSDTEDTEDAEDTEDPTGSTTGDGGGSSSGGNPGSGGGSSGGNPGVGGAEPECQPPGSGGGVYLYNCSEWLRQDSVWDPQGDEAHLAEDCSTETGQGGAAAFKPALKQLCETVGSVQQEQDLVHCLTPLAQDACATDHEEKLLTCLTRPRPCEASGHLCPNLTNECPNLDQDLCYWGMNEARSTDRADSVVECFLSPEQGESCDEAFLRCAWGLTL